MVAVNLHKGSNKHIWSMSCKAPLPWKVEKVIYIFDLFLMYIPYKSSDAANGTKEKSPKSVTFLLISIMWQPTHVTGHYWKKFK